MPGRRRRMPRPEQIHIVPQSAQHVVSQQPIIVHGATEIRRGGSYVDIHGVRHEPVELVVRGTGRGRRAMPRRAAEPIDLNDVLKQHAEMMAAQKKRVGGVLESGKTHATFIKGLTPTKRGIPTSFLNALFPSWRSGAIWDIHPLAAIGAAYNRLKSPKSGRAPSDLRAAGGKGIFTSLRAEEARESAKRFKIGEGKQAKWITLPELRAQFVAEVKPAYEQWKNTANDALAELQRNPTLEQLGKYNHIVSTATEEFRRKEGAAISKFSKITAASGFGTGGQRPMPTHRL